VLAFLAQIDQRYASYYNQMLPKNQVLPNLP